MSAVNVERILQEIVELRQENKDYNLSVEFMNLKYDNLTNTINKMKLENKVLKQMCDELKTENYYLVIMMNLKLMLLMALLKNANS